MCQLCGPFFFASLATKTVSAQQQMHGDCVYKSHAAKQSAWISSLKTSYCYKTVLYIVNDIVVAGNAIWYSKQKVIQ